MEVSVGWVIILSEVFIKRFCFTEVSIGQQQSRKKHRNVLNMFGC